VAPFETTLQLAKVVSDANPAWEKHKHPATRVFQAIRIFINQELEDLQVLLSGVLDVLKVGGRLAVISFHSLEDRLVKNFMRDQTRGFSHANRLPSRVPVQHEGAHVRMRLVSKPQRPSAAEVENNPRARSAILRVAEKIA
jgi:16S rRNA (cytosine1402-N4)-methyltransferase